MRLAALTALAAATACGGSAGDIPFDILGKLCATNQQCAPAANVTCGPILLDPPGPEYACELAPPDPSLSSGGCPKGTHYWIAVLQQSPFQQAGYCAPDCQQVPGDMTGHGTCNWNRLCLGVCTI